MNALCDHGYGLKKVKSLTAHSITRSYDCELPKLNRDRDIHYVPGLDTIGHVHSVETCGTVDGPGLRYVLFLSGCPLRCLYCHNPDAQGRPRGRVHTAAAIIEDVLRYRSFIQSGGLTISGGEPLFQADFVHAIFQAARRAGIHTALDTSGFLGARASEALLAETDLVLLDIKSFSAGTYQHVTGVRVEPTLHFAKRLERLDRPVWIRFVLVPGLTDAEDNLAGVAEYVASLGNVQRVEVLPFHKMGEHKYRQLGMRYELDGTPEPTEAEVARCHRIFADYGITVH